MTRFTILGSSGFIGTELKRYLTRLGDEVLTPARDDSRLPRNPGHVVYCIGVTADFRSRPYDTMEAHVGRLSGLLSRGGFDSLLYLSSTRVYGFGPDASENAVLRVDPACKGDLYNLSKLAGEALCLAHPLRTVRIARLSNVYGYSKAFRDSANFLPSIIRDAIIEGEIRIETAPNSAKDYIAVEDVARAIRQIALNGRERIYNVASGQNVSHAEIAAAIAATTSCRVTFAADARTVACPPIATDVLRTAFQPPDPPWIPESLTARLPNLVAGTQIAYREPNSPKPLRAGAIP